MKKKQKRKEGGMVAMNSNLLDENSQVAEKNEGGMVATNKNYIPRQEKTRPAKSNV